MGVVVSNTDTMRDLVYRASGPPVPPSEPAAPADIIAYITNTRVLDDDALSAVKRHLDPDDGNRNNKTINRAITTLNDTAVLNNFALLALPEDTKIINNCPAWVIQFVLEQRYLRRVKKYIDQFVFNKLKELASRSLEASRRSIDRQVDETVQGNEVERLRQELEQCKNDKKALEECLEALKKTITDASEDMTAPFQLPPDDSSAASSSVRSEDTVTVDLDLREEGGSGSGYEDSERFDRADKAMNEAREAVDASTSNIGATGSSPAGASSALDVSSASSSAEDPTNP